MWVILPPLTFVNKYYKKKGCFSRKDRKKQANQSASDVQVYCVSHRAFSQQQPLIKHPKADRTKEQSEHQQHYRGAALHCEAEAAGHFCLASSTAWKILPTLLPLWELLCFHSPKIKTAAMFPRNKCLTSWAGVNTDIMLTGSRGSHL